MKKILFLILAASVIISLAGVACTKIKEEKKMPMIIKSAAFKNNEYLPKKYAGDGDDISPPLEFENIPKGTKSFVLIVDDPDAPSGAFTHWVVFNIPAGAEEFKEGEVPAGSVIGKNSANELKYLGPYPPSGKPHHYMFKLFALSVTLNLKEGATKKEVEAAMS